VVGVLGGEGSRLGGGEVELLIVGWGSFLGRGCGACLGALVGGLIWGEDRWGGVEDVWWGGVGWWVTFRGGDGGWLGGAVAGGAGWGYFMSSRGWETSKFCGGVGGGM